MKKVIIIQIITLLLSETANAQEGWFTLFAEYGTTTSYTGLQFINENTGYLTASWGDAHNNGGATTKTTNGGYNWFTVESSVSRYGLFFLNEQTGWTFGGYWNDAGQKSREVFRTTNGGANFQRVFIDSLQYSFRRMYFANAYTGWIATTSNIIKSTNSGLNWSVCSDLSVNSIFFTDANTGRAVTSTGIIYKTTNEGTNWLSEFTVLGNAFTYVTFLNPNTGWVSGSPPNIYKTTNAGNSWLPHAAGASALVSNIKFTDSLNGWACSQSGEIFRSFDGGINWSHQITIDSLWITGLSFPSQLTGYALGTYIVTPNSHNNKLLKTTTGGVIFVQSIGNEVPEKFSLSQNYPNPFNPVTKIKFDIPPHSFGEEPGVRLIIYDALGREITTLVNEQLQPGTYEVEWDGTNYPSGVYFYKFAANDYSETKKMVLVK